MTRRRRRGSKKGNISFIEAAWILIKRWAYWIGTLAFVFIGEAASYVKDNWSAIQMSLPWYVAAGILGAVGVVLMVRDGRKVVKEDTRPPEERV